MSDELSGVAISMRLQESDRQDLMDHLQSIDHGIGKTIKLEVADVFGRFPVGTFIVRIETFIPHGSVSGKQT